MILWERPRWWDRSPWFRVYTPGAFDGWATLTGRRMPCDTMRAAMDHPGWRDDIRRLISR